MTVSPGANSGILRSSWAISSCSSFWIRFIFVFLSVSGRLAFRAEPNEFGCARFFKGTGHIRHRPVHCPRSLLLLRRLPLAAVFVQQLPVFPRELLLLDQVGPPVPGAPQRL